MKMKIFELQEDIENCQNEDSPKIIIKERMNLIKNIESKNRYSIKDLIKSPFL